MAELHPERNGQMGLYQGSAYQPAAQCSPTLGKGVDGENTRTGIERLLEEGIQGIQQRVQTQLGTIAVKGGYNLQDAFDVFGNDNILGIIADA